MEKEKVVILCGGMGTRLREETEFKPKALVEVGGYPILWHIMKTYSSYGFNDFVLCLGYKGHMIKNYFKDFHHRTKDFTLNLRSREILSHAGKEPPDWNITFAETGLHSLTGFRVKKIQKYIREENFLLTYCDGVANIDINSLLNFHKSHNKIATVTSIIPPTRWSHLNISNDNQQVQSFAKGKKLEGWWIDGGFFVFNQGIFDYLSDKEDCFLEREPMEKLAADGQLHSFKHDGFWQCMDTVRDSQYLNDLWNSGKAPWKIWQNNSGTEKTFL